MSIYENLTEASGYYYWRVLKFITAIVPTYLSKAHSVMK
jgi:hypothetical protein